MSYDNTSNISKQALQRMPYYLQYLKEVKKSGVQTIASTVIGIALNLNDVQVRKDLAAICTTKGKPKSGFDIDELIANMEDFLGYNNTMDAVLVGVGSLGKALMSYREFDKYGLNIVAAFDIDEELIGKVVCGKQIFALDKLYDLCKRMKVHIGIITVPADFAQSVADHLVESGILAIWNFAPIKLNVKDNILIQNENLAASLAVLSQHLRLELLKQQNDLEAKNQ
jgi:redox-sensing transcriptional repressor